MSPDAGARSDSRTSGSPANGEPLFLAVGRLRRPHGVSGELLMEVVTDFPERIEPGMAVFVGPERREMRLIHVRPHGKNLLISLEGITDREQAGFLRNHWVAVRMQDRPPLPPGDYYHHELLGLRIHTEDGRDLGTVVEILETGANDVFLVRAEGGSDILIPMIDEVILHIDLEKAEIRVRLLPGLVPD